AKLPLYTFKRMKNRMNKKESVGEMKESPVAFLDSLLLEEVTTLRRGLPKFQVDKVLQPFDENKFNFTKVGQEEVFFRFEESDTDETQFFPSAPIDTEDSPNVVVAINVSFLTVNK
ncbi:hypothetical protein IFM89_022079, partial [Coptis chinensis]